MQSGRFSEAITTTPCNKRDSNTCYLFWNQYEQYQSETRRRGNTVSATSRWNDVRWDLSACSDNGEEHVRTVEDEKNLS